MLLNENILYKRLEAHSKEFCQVINYNALTDKIAAFNFSANNIALQNIDIANTELFCIYINKLLHEADAKFGIGGYNEIRNLYSGSSLFDNKAPGEEPRRLHLGIDIWGEPETEIFAPLDGTIHSFAFNNNFGDYGATIILKHGIEKSSFYTLYGHLSVADLKEIKEGDLIKRGHQFAHFGSIEDNGHWPPHLHFQVIDDIGNYKGDYPGVCKFSEREKYLTNCPDPDLILNMDQYAIN